jgi:carboxylesterase type B
MFCRTPVANRGRPIEWSSYFCYASPPSGGFRFRSVITTDENRELTRKRWQLDENECRPPIANQGRPIEWSSYFCYASPPSGGFRFRSVQKPRIPRERWQLDEKCLQNTNSKLGSTYRMVKLLQLGGATCC